VVPNGSRRAARIPLGAEFALAFTVGAASFGVMAVALASLEPRALVALIGAAGIVAVLAVERYWGIAYAVPAAIAVLVAYDWFVFPPTHPRAFPDSANLAGLLVYIAVAALVGELAAHATRRADVSEAARTELAEDHAALRRVATLVARGVAPHEVFDAVAAEVGVLLGVQRVCVVRYDGEDVEQLAGWSAPGYELSSLGRARLEGRTVTAEVLRTGRGARIDDYTTLNPFVHEHGIQSAVGAPIVVAGRLWGVILAWSMLRRLPDTTEDRLAEFTSLVAMAIANTTGREQLARLADEQAALRRVATVVARESSPAPVFAAVAEEVARLLGVEDTRVYRFDDGFVTVVAQHGEPGFDIPVGARAALGGENVGSQVQRTGRAARLDDYTKATGALADVAGKLGVRSAVGSPIVVEGRVWGAIIVASREDPLPPTTEERVGQFTELVATAISNVLARSAVAASRARIVAATDEERRRVVRDLHDGAQQRLVHTVITLKLARAALDDDKAGAPALVTEALHQAEGVMVELRELAHGILPSVLTWGGLGPGVEALASRMSLPVDVRVSVDRLGAEVEATGYFVVAEALTNVAKHARARRASVGADVTDGVLHIEVRDDGVGGARQDGSGLQGLADRLAVLSGCLRVQSPADGGTLVSAVIPVTGPS
jgi:signal transduction histidine kinase